MRQSVDDLVRALDALVLALRSQRKSHRPLSDGSPYKELAGLA